MANEGPQLEDPGVIARRLSGGGAGADGGGSGGGGQRPDNPIENSSRFASRLLRMVGIQVKLSSMFDTGLFKQFTPPQSGFDKPINQGAGGLNLRGGAGTNFIAKSLQLDSAKDFSKLVKPAVEGYPVQSLSYGSLGNLVPNDSGGGGGIGGPSR
jgi:hypothetical protein